VSTRLPSQTISVRKRAIYDAPMWLEEGNEKRWPYQPWSLFELSPRQGVDESYCLVSGEGPTRQKLAALQQRVNDAIPVTVGIPDSISRVINVAHWFGKGFSL